MWFVSDMYNYDAVDADFDLYVACVRVSLFMMLLCCGDQRCTICGLSALMTARRFLCLNHLINCCSPQLLFIPHQIFVYSNVCL